MGSRVDRQVAHAELERARTEFAALVERAGPGDLRRPSHGTRWTNEQLLFHMLFGYLIVRTLLGPGSAVQEIAAKAPGAKLVKAFNTTLPGRWPRAG